MLVATLWAGDDEVDAEVLDRVIDGLNVDAVLLDYSAGGNPTYRFEGSAANLAVLRKRVGADES